MKEAMVKYDPTDSSVINKLLEITVKILDVYKLMSHKTTAGVIIDNSTLGVKHQQYETNRTKLTLRNGVWVA
ncbi:MAG: hypothetical protein ACTS6G_00675 [Candidatus Hodgkinia cicadicola]